MSKIVEFQPRVHVYELEKCAGCSKEIEGDYLEIVLPIGDTTGKKHIALCSNCQSKAQKQGVIN